MLKFAVNSVVQNLINNRQNIWSDILQKMIYHASKHLQMCFHSYLQGKQRFPILCGHMFKRLGLFSDGFSVCAPGKALSPQPPILPMSCKMNFYLFMVWYCTNGHSQKRK